MRRAMPTSWRWSPRYVCGPSRDGDEGLLDHHGSSCGHGSRASVCGSCYAADTYALTRHDSGLLRSGIDTHVRVGCQAKAINPGIKAKMLSRFSLPPRTDFGHRTGVQLAANLSCRVETPS